MDIDLVYLWVDGGDPKWRAKRDAFIGRPTGSEVNCEGRYADNGELKYSLRSVEKNAPWLRKIFIVTDDQTPAWLDVSNPKVQIIDHKEIIPADCLPCFNSSVLEHYICNIPGLAEHFLYANDDMFLNRPVSPETFFAEDGLPIIRLTRRPLRKLIVTLREKLGWPLNNYGKKLHRSALLAQQKYGKYYGDKPHHNIDAYLKSDCLHTKGMFEQEIAETSRDRVRSSNNIHRFVYTCIALAEGRGHKRYVSKRTSLKFHIQGEQYRKIERYNPTFFCMNDTQKTTDADREQVTTILERLFPEKSQFEKQTF